jgi:hypothetical protein
MVNNTLKPEVFMLPEEAPIGEVNRKEIDKEDQALSNLSHVEGWNILTAFIEDQIEEIDGLVATAIAGGLDYEEIGKKTIVATLAKSYIRKILDKVNDAKQIVEQSRE